METTLIFPAHHDATDEKDTRFIRPFSVFNSSSEQHPELIQIVAMAKNRAIGFNGDIPWHLPEDLKHFKATTMGHPVIMGRKTWESLPFKPLKGRRNVVVTRNADYIAQGADTFQSIEEAIAACKSDETPIIIGGEQIYRQSIPFASALMITEVDLVPENADAFFPEIDPAEWRECETTDWMVSKSGIRFRYVNYKRKR